MSLYLRHLSWLLPFVFGQAPSKTAAVPPGGAPVPWAAVSIHPSDPDKNSWNGGEQADGIDENGMDVRGFISEAYSFNIMSMHDDEITGLPNWTRNVRYDIHARVDSEDVPAFKKISELPMQETIAAYTARQYTGEMLMKQQLLTDRFHFKMHWESRERSAYTLMLSKGGSKLKPAADPKHGELTFSQGHLEGKGVPASFIASLLSQPLGRSVVDKTGLTGVYDFDLKFQPQEKIPDPNSSDPDLLTALQEQLGLKLQSSQASLPFMVVDHIEEPTPN